MRKTAVKINYKVENSEKITFWGCRKKRSYFVVIAQTFVQNFRDTEFCGKYKGK